jgi:hypothetical protein
MTDGNCSGQGSQVVQSSPQRPYDVEPQPELAFEQLLLPPYDRKASPPLSDTPCIVKTESIGQTVQKLDYESFIFEGTTGHKCYQIPSPHFNQPGFREGMDEAAAPPAKRPRLTEEEVIESSVNSTDAFEYDPDICLSQVVELFPDIDLDFALKLIGEVIENGEKGAVAIEKILELKSYPKERDAQRKRRENEEAIKRLESDPRTRPCRVLALIDSAPEARRPLLQLYYSNDMRRHLMAQFPFTPAQFIDKTISVHKTLYAIFLQLIRSDKASLTDRPPPYRRLKTRRQQTRVHQSEEFIIEMMLIEIANVKREAERLGLVEQQAGDEALAKQLADEEQQESNMIMECQCCFGDESFQNMTHCNGDDCHFFCLNCAKLNAQNVLGQGRHILKCMDQSGCNGGFDNAQIERFLPIKETEMLEKLKQADELQLAELPGFERCPFCDFGAICPDVETDREFRCEGPDCGLISCRLCHSESHIPLSCDEYKAEKEKNNKENMRHVLEEQLSESLIRKCTKCQTPFLKTEGCNKMKCPKCGNLQCYICHKSINKEGYKHFNERRDGEGGGCVLFEETAQIHQQNLTKAVEEAKKKIFEANPDVDFSDAEFTDTLPKFPPTKTQPRAANVAAVPVQPPVPVPGSGLPDVLRRARALRAQAAQVTARITQTAALKAVQDQARRKQAMRLYNDGPIVLGRDGNLQTPEAVGNSQYVPPNILHGMRFQVAAPTYQPVPPQHAGGSHRIQFSGANSSVGAMGGITNNSNTNANAAINTVNFGTAGNLRARQVVQPVSRAIQWQPLPSPPIPQNTDVYPQFDIFHSQPLLVGSNGSNPADLFSLTGPQGYNLTAGLFGDTIQDLGAASPAYTNWNAPPQRDAFDTGDRPGSQTWNLSMNDRTLAALDNPNFVPKIDRQQQNLGNFPRDRGNFQAPVDHVNRRITADVRNPQLNSYVGIQRVVSHSTTTDGSSSRQGEKEAPIVIPDESP